MFLDGPMIFYLRDEPSYPDLKRLARRLVTRPRPPKPQTKFRGLPLVCVAVGNGPTPDSLRFSVATVNPADLAPDVWPKVLFSKERSRRIALGRLLRQKTISTRITPNTRRYRLPREEFTAQVGMVFPMPHQRDGEHRGMAIQRTVIGLIANPTNGFAPTAQRLARHWLAASFIAGIGQRSQGQEAKATSNGVELTDELVINLAEEAEKGYDVSQLRPRPEAQPTV